MPSNRKRIRRGRAPYGETSVWCAFVTFYHIIVTSLGILRETMDETTFCGQIDVERMRVWKKIRGSAKKCFVFFTNFNVLRKRLGNRQEISTLYLARVTNNDRTQRDVLQIN